MFHKSGQRPRTGEALRGLSSRLHYPMNYHLAAGMELLHRISHRTDASGFILWTHTYLEDRADTITRSDRRVIEKANELLHALVMDSDQLENALGSEAAAHTAARRVNVHQEIELRELRERVEVLQRKNDDLRAWLHSGEIRTHGEDLDD